MSYEDSPKLGFTFVGSKRLKVFIKTGSHEPAVSPGSRVEFAASEQQRLDDVCVTVADGRDDRRLTEAVQLVHVAP